MGVVRSTPGLTNALTTALPIHAGTDFFALADFEWEDLRTAFLALVSVLISTDFAEATQVGKSAEENQAPSDTRACLKTSSEGRIGPGDDLVIAV